MMLDVIMQLCKHLRVSNVLLERVVSWIADLVALDQLDGVVFM